MLAAKSILVVRLGKTNRFALTKALEGLKLFFKPVVGLVTNSVKGWFQLVIETHAILACS